MNNYYNPEPPVDPPEDRTIAICSVCMGEIYDGEYYGLDDYSRPICSDCLESEWNHLAKDEKFELMGYEVKR